MFKASLNLKKFKTFFKRIPQIIVEHAFWSIIISLLVALAIGSLIGYRHVFVVGIQEPEPSIQFTHFDEGAYNELQRHWEEREKLREEKPEEYLDLFKKQ